MSNPFAKLLIPGLCAVALAACGSAEEPNNQDPNGSGGTDAGGTDAGGTDSGGTDSGGTDSGGTDSGGTGGSGTGGSGTAGTGTAGTGNTGCEAWYVTYDLAGSTFEISGTPANAGNKKPFEIGPGTLTLRFPNDGGEPGESGAADMHLYDMKMDFLVESFGIKVTTDLRNTAGPADCGVAEGIMGGKLTWSGPRGIRDVHSVGNIHCEASGFINCGTGGLSDGDNPQDETSDQEISDFSFSNGVSSFTSAPVATKGENSITTLTLMGTESARELKAAPDCFCN